MSRTSIFLVAAGYMLSFLVVCLGTCLAGAPPAEHACCVGEDGFRAAARDCCHVTPGASPDGPLLAQPGPSGAPLSDAVVYGPSLVAAAPAAKLAASPPLVLRI